MWWLDDITMQVRPAVTPKYSAEKRGAVVPRPPRRRERLIDRLTAEQRAANLLLSQCHDGYANEIERLHRNVQSLEKAVRDKSSCLERLTGELAVANEQRASDARRFGSFIVGYEAFLATRNDDVEGLQQQLVETKTVAAEEIAELESALRHQRGLGESVAITAAVSAERTRNERKVERDEASRHACDLEKRNEQLVNRLNVANQELGDTNSTLQNLEKEYVADRSRLQIEISVLQSRLESSESNRRAQSSRLATSETGLDAWEQQAYRQRASVEQARLRIAELGDRLATQTHLAQQTASEVESLQQTLAKEQERLRIVTEEADQSEESLRMTCEQLDRLRGTLDQCRDELARSSRDHQTSLNELEQKSKDIEQLRDRFGVTLEQLHATEVERDTLRNELAETSSLSESATGQLQRQNASIAEMREQELRLIELHDSQCQSFEQRIDDLQSTIDDLAQALDFERNERIAVEFELRNENESYCIEIDQLRAKVDRERNERSAEEQNLRRENESRVAEIDQLKAAVEHERCERSAVQRKLQEENDSLSIEIGRLSMVVEDSKTYQSETAKLKAQLSAGTARGSLVLEQYRAKIKAAGEQIERLRAEIQFLSRHSYRRAA